MKQVTKYCFFFINEQRSSKKYCYLLMDTRCNQSKPFQIQCCCNKDFFFALILPGCCMPNLHKALQNCISIRFHKLFKETSYLVRTFFF